MQLTHIYDSKFINKFPKNIQKILDNHSLTDSFSINITSLATQLGIQINSKLNPNDPTDRMKIAEIIGNQLVQYVQDDPNWYRAVQAHKLAEQLLMPKKLIIKALHQFMPNDKSSVYVDYQTLEKIYQHLANMLNLNVSSVEYRLKMLNMITY